jgi:hypothetical protein
LLPFLVWPLLPTQCRGLLLHEITLRHTAHGRAALYEWSARRRDFWLWVWNGLCGMVTVL